MLVQIYKKSGGSEKLVGNELISFICLVGKLIHKGTVELDYKHRGLPVILQVGA